MAGPLPSGPSEIGKKICELLGVDPHLTKSIQIDIEVNDLVMIKVDRYASEGELEEVVEVFRAVDWKKQEKREG